MAEYDNRNTGALFKAKDQPTDKHPGYTGSINVDGTEYWLAGWVKESKAGQKYFSLSVKPKEDKPKDDRNSAPGTKFDDFKSDIPFR